MRHVLPLLLAALAACQVDVEGARCQTAEHCPAGQGCGVDERCSTLAATCALETVGARTRDCEHDGLVCGQKSGAPSCECPPNDGAEFAVAAPGSVSEAEELAPTGAAEPPECRFRSLTAAIVAASNAGGGSVVAMGGTAGQPAFSAATGETLPIDIPAGVTVTTDRSPGAAYAIRLDDAGAAAAVRLHAGAALGGFVIENAAGDSTRDAIELACDGTDLPARLDGVTMHGEGPDAQHQLKRGILVNGTCGIAATDVVVTGMQVEALRVEATDPAVESTFVGGAFERSGKGVHLKQGVLRLEGVRIEGNAGKGIEAGSSSGETVLELTGVKVLGNGDTGVAVFNNTRLFIVDTTVFGNAAQTMWGELPFLTPSGAARLCGGIVLRGAPPLELETPTFRFERNRVYSNAGDQVLVLTTGGGTWKLGAPGCAPGSADLSVLGCYDKTTTAPPTGAYRGLFALDAIAEARYFAWGLGSLAPTTADFKAHGDGSDVDVGGATALYCVLPKPLDCSSPDPK